MFRWEDVTAQTIYDMEVKMYRDPYEALKTFAAPNEDVELDWYAFSYLQSELFVYKILDINFAEYIEERGNASRISSIAVPITQNNNGEIL